jgi:hypothetical protein
MVNKPARIKVKRAKKASKGQLMKPISQLINNGPQQFKPIAAALGHWWVNVPLPNVTEKQTLGTNKGLFTPVRIRWKVNQPLTVNSQ